MEWLGVSFALVLLQGVSGTYYGKFLAELTTRAHRVSGKVYVASEDSLYLVGLNYDGAGPDAFFWLSPGEEASPDGVLTPDENGSRHPLRRYSNQTILLTLEEGTRITDYGSFALWCREFTENFGQVRIPRNLELPAEQTIGNFQNGAHAIRSAAVTLLDSQTVHIAQFYYDGTGPDAYFMVGNSDHVTDVAATKVPNNKGSTQKLGRYDGEDIVLHLPASLDWSDVKWLSVYCISASADLAHIRVPRELSVPVKLPGGVPRTNGRYLGNLIGPLQNTVHGVSGNVYAAKKNVLVLEDFVYDGLGPDAFFMVGTTNEPSPTGTVLPNEAGSVSKLSRYEKKTIVLTLPSVITNYKWFSVYCKKAKVSFGHVVIPTDLDYPKELVLSTAWKGAHRTRSGPVILKDINTLFLSDFGYDGSAPDAYFLCGKGQINGRGIKVPDEHGRTSKLKGYNNVDLTLKFPDGVTAFDVDWFAIYCIRFAEVFASVRIPSNPNVPPDIVQLTMAQRPTVRAQQLQSSTQLDNCEEILPNHLQVGWKIQGSDIVLHLRARASRNEWASFGISGNRDKSQMVGGDVAVAYYDQSKVTLKDFTLESKAQCSTNGGVCPDDKRGGKDNLKLISSSHTNGILEVVYSRPLAAGDSADKNIPGSGDIAIIAAIGPKSDDNTVLYHTTHYLKRDTKLTFSREPQKNCVALKESTGILSEDAFAARKIAGINEFTAEIGPTGGIKGYEKITGFSGWGISWWINGQLIPVLYVERGITYTFKVNGGHDPDNSARYHPFYITDNQKGGGSKVDPSELGKPGHLLLAGVVMGADGKPDVSKGIGRYCEWEHKDVDKSDQVKSFEEYKNTLELKCEEGQPGTFTWTPDKDTPDTVYYQCFTHFFLGWKIRVLNPGEDPQDDDKKSSATIARLSVTLVSLVAAMQVSYAS
ncbi:protein Skeletor, isoforms B/C-like isoform X2 [Ornithodoros turicata]|uniref:protein Skeletor, isoforms B/C-like isoform X2 n=1 Tax=Ornithodoros turicata TaxID=34597 RepID=UPI003138D2A5